MHPQKTLVRPAANQLFPSVIGKSLALLRGAFDNSWDPLAVFLTVRKKVLPTSAQSETPSLE